MIDALRMLQDMKTDLIGDGLRPGGFEIRQIRARLSVSCDPWLKVTLVAAEEGAVDLAALIHRSVDLHWQSSDFDESYGLMVWEGQGGWDDSQNTHVYTLTLVPKMLVMTQAGRISSFCDTRVPDILRAVLVRNGFREQDDFELRLREEEYPPRPFLLQYKETDWEFIKRLCEHWGISFFFQTVKGGYHMVFSDDTSNWALEAYSEIPYVRSGEQTGVVRFDQVYRAVPRRYVLADYQAGFSADPISEAIDLESGPGEGLHEYAPNMVDSDDGAFLARIRREELESRKCHYAGEVANNVLLKAGRVFRLTGHPTWDGRDFVVVHSDWEMNFTSMAADVSLERPLCVTRFEAVDATTAYRPPRRTPAPRVDGLLPAKVLSSTDDPARPDLDDLGRYRVRLLFTETPDQDAHYPYVRMAQPHGSGRYGMHFPLLPGTEVTLAFIDGDIDRPVIVGAAENVTAPSVVTRANITQNILRSPAQNLFQMDDRKDHENLHLETPDGTYVRLGQIPDPVPAPEKADPYVASPAAGLYVRTPGEITQMSSRATTVDSDGDYTLRVHQDKELVQQRYGADGSLKAETRLTPSADFTFTPVNTFAISGGMSSTLVLGRNLFFTMGMGMSGTQGGAVSMDAGLKTAFSWTRSVEYAKGSSYSRSNTKTLAAVAETSETVAAREISLSVAPNAAVNVGSSVAHGAMVATLVGLGSVGALAFGLGSSSSAATPLNATTTTAGAMALLGSHIMYVIDKANKKAADALQAAGQGTGLNLKSTSATLDAPGGTVVCPNQLAIKTLSQTLSGNFVTVKALNVLNLQDSTGAVTVKITPAGLTITSGGPVSITGTQISLNGAVTVNGVALNA